MKWTFLGLLLMSSNALAIYPRILNPYTNTYDFVGVDPSVTVASMTVSSITVLNQITIPNGVNPTDAAAFGQLGGSFQVAIQATTTSATSTTSSSFVTTSLAATITPTSASHRIKITVSGNMSNGDGSNTNPLITIERGSTNLASSGFFNQCSTNSALFLDTPVSIAYIDSPATTSATTYTVYIRSQDGVHTVEFNRIGVTCIITLEEIS